ncbi:hypothetical protein F4777DRAFT_582777 [Nemania sp. FL0916]|nr:hypothetical protein F4777DRAFT_582777 [Nemania sp. FL0916]
MATNSTSRKDLMDWERYKTILWKLYMEEKKPLGAVMEIMASDHSFVATQKQCLIDLSGCPIAIKIKHAILGFADVLLTRIADRYQFGVKWEWKKYNQNDSKQALAPNTGLQQYGSLNGIQRNSMGDGLPDFKSLSVLRKDGTKENLSWCLRDCLSWCGKALAHGSPKADYEATTGLDPDDSSDFYDCNAQVFKYLLDHYMSVPDNGWDCTAGGAIRLCPIKMLCTMSTLLVNTASAVVNQQMTMCRPTSSSDVPSSNFAVALLGIENARRWKSEKLVQEFIDEFAAILKDPDRYEAAMGPVVRCRMP